MTSMAFWAGYYGFRSDASEAFIQGYLDEVQRLDQRGQGVACGRGWIPRSKKCSPDKAKQTSKEAKAKTVEKAKARAKLKGEVKAAKGQKPRVKRPAIWGFKQITDLDQESRDEVSRQVAERLGEKTRDIEELSGSASELWVRLRGDLYPRLLDVSKEPLPKPKPADPAKLEAFNNAFSGSGKERQAFIEQSVKSQKFKNQQIEVATVSGKRSVPASVNGDLAFAKSKDISADGKGSGYSITHVPSGLKITDAKNVKEAKAITATLTASGLDWRGDPSKLPPQDREALRDLLGAAYEGAFRGDSSDISLAEALYG